MDCGFFINDDVLHRGRVCMFFILYREEGFLGLLGCRTMYLLRHIYRGALN